MLRKLDLAAAFLAYGLAVVWLAASSSFAWLAIAGFGNDREALSPSIGTVDHVLMIGICLTPTLASCGLAMIATRDRRLLSTNVFGFVALSLIIACFGVAALWANQVAHSDI